MFTNKEIKEKIKSIDDSLTAILFHLKKITNKKVKEKEKDVYNKL